MNRWLGTGQLAQRSYHEKPGAGYTIVEVMVVLSVTVMLFFAVSLTFRGRQASVEFSQAVRSYEAKLQSIMTEIMNGYYETKYECNTIGNTDSPDPSVVPAPTGTNEDCIFMGKVVASGELESKIVTMVGRRTVTDGLVTRDVRDLSESNPTLFPDDISGGPNEYSTSYTHSFRLRVTRVIRLDSGLPADVPAFAFVNPLSAAVSSNRLTQLYGYPGSTMPVDPASLTTLPVAMPDGIKICLQGQNNQRAEVLIGARNAQTTISSVLDTQAGGGCP